MSARLDVKTGLCLLLRKGYELRLVNKSYLRLAMEGDYCGGKAYVDTERLHEVCCPLRHENCEGEWKYIIQTSRQLKQNDRQRH
jgi:hypothetical protein